MFISCSSVSAKVVTLDDMVNVINKGVITEEFIDLKENEKDDKTGKIKWRDAQIKAYIENEALIVEYTYTNKDLISTGKISATMQEDGITLKSVIEYNDKDEYHPLEEIEVHNLIPLWEIEASNSWSEITEYVDGGYINKINSIIDRCYRKEMHACRTSVSTYGQHQYISDVEMNESAAFYVIDKLEEEAEEKESKRFNTILLIVAVVLILLMLLLKSSEPKKKAIKY
jgi:hypothetical protein